MRKLLVTLLFVAIPIFLVILYYLKLCKFRKIHFPGSCKYLDAVFKHRNYLKVEK